MVQRNMMVFGWGALISLATLGCSGGDSRIDSSLDDDKMAHELSDEEAQEFCVAASEYFEKQFPVSESCKGAGLSAFFTASLSGDDPLEACEDAVDSCIEDDDGVSLECSDDADVPSSCTATVGEIETCLADTIDAQVEAWDKLNVPDCDGMEEFLEEADSSELLGALETDISEIESCESIDESCLEDDDDDEEAE